MSPSSRTELGRTVAMDAAEPAPAGAGEPSPGGDPRLPGADAAARLDAREERLRFAVEAALGIGATGEVWSVRDRTLDRLVAVKVLRRELLGDQAARGGFVAEARLTAALNHPNVLPVHDFDLTEDGRPFFAMARIDGRSLAEAVEASTPAARLEAIAGVNAVVSIAIAVCNAVAYAHHRGIVHQDIKPDNIMLGDFGEVLLLDWGSAARLGPDGRVSSGLYGTPLYMSPEQARREHAERRSDVYGIGATLFHALTLRLPIWDDEPERFWERKRRGEITPPTAAELAATPPALLAIALKAMAPDPAARYAAVEDLRRELERFQAGLAVDAYREPWWLRLRRWYRRRAALVWVSATAAAAVAAAVGFAALQIAAEREKERSRWEEVDGLGVAASSLVELERDWRPRLSESWSGPFADFPPGNDGHLALADGGVVLDAEAKPLIDLALRAPVRGDVRFDWDARLLGGPADNLNCFFGAADRLGGFTFHVGGFNRPGMCTLTRGGETEYLLSRPLAAPLVAGRTYHFRLEYADRHLRLGIDGEPVIDYLDAEDAGGLGKRFGFDCVSGHRIWIGRVEVMHKPRAQRISALEIGDRLLQIGAPADAAPEFADIVAAYPDTDAAVAAQFRLALCEAAEGRKLDAAKALISFARTHDRHELAVPALVRASRLAGELGERDLREEVWKRLRAYRGHPLLEGVLRDIERDLALRFNGLPRERLVATAVAGQDAVVRWADDLGVTLGPVDDYCHESTELMRDAGFFEEILSRLPRPSEEGQARSLVELGRPEEALRRFSRPEAVVPALAALGRLREVADGPRNDFNARMLALYHLGDFERMRRLGPSFQITEELDLYAGRFEKYLREHPVDSFGFDFGESPRVDALIDAGRADEVLRDYRHEHARSLALAALGRFDEAVAIAEYAADAPMLAVIARARAGDRAACERFLALVRQRRDRSFADHGACKIEPLMFVPLALAGMGDDSGMRSELEALATEPRRRFGCQRPWYLAAYALGRLEDAEFLAQPMRFQADAYLLLAQGLRRDLAGDRAGAAARYRELLAMDFWRRDLGHGLFEVLQWRIESAGLTVPENATTATMSLSYR